MGIKKKKNTVYSEELLQCHSSNTRVGSQLTKTIDNNGLNTVYYIYRCGSREINSIGKNINIH